MGVIPLGEELALAAVRLLLSHPDVPIADALIASLVKIGEAEDVITDDPHYQDMKVRTVGLKCPHRREGACDQPLPGGKSTPHPSGGELAAGYPMISIYSARTYLSALLV